MRLPDEVFQSIVGCAPFQLEKGRGQERRRQGRVRLPARVQVIPMSQSVAGHPINCQVRDLSPTGIGLLMPQKLMAGDHLLIRLVSKGANLWVLCDVTRVERVAQGLYVTGATYNRIVAPGSTPEKLQAVGQAG